MWQLKLIHTHRHTKKTKKKKHTPAESSLECLVVAIIKLIRTRRAPKRKDEKIPEVLKYGLSPAALPWSVVVAGLVQGRRGRMSRWTPPGGVRARSRRTRSIRCSGDSPAPTLSSRRERRTQPRARAGRLRRPRAPPPLLTRCLAARSESGTLPNAAGARCAAQRVCEDAERRGTADCRPRLPLPAKENFARGAGAADYR